MTKEQVLSIVRWLLTALGPTIVAHGWITDATWQSVSGVILTLVPLIWAMISKTPSGIIKAAAALPQVDKIVTTPEIANVKLATEPKVVTR